MDDTELEAMVVRLLGDGSSYAHMMKEAQDTTRQTRDVIQQQATQIEGFKNTLTSFAGTAVTALGALGAANWLREGLKAWDDQEKANIKLGAVMEANGREVQSLTVEYNDFASEMQRVTTMADEVTLSVLAQAESFGLTGEAARQATQNAIGIAAINDGNAQSYLRFTAAMARGDTRMMMQFARMIPQLRGIKNETELMAKAQQLAATGFKTAQELAKTYSGQMEQLKNAYSDFMEDVGKTTAEVLVPLVRVVRSVVDWMQKWDISTKQVVTYLALAAAAVLAVVTAITAFGFVAGPIAAAFVSGFAVVKGAILMVLAPLLIIKGVLLALAVVGGLVFTPLGWAITLAGLALVGLVRRAGGLVSMWTSIRDWGARAWMYIKKQAGIAWDYIYERASAFYEWLKPITDAAAAFAVTAWNLIMRAATVAWNWIMRVASEAWTYVGNVWRGMFGDAEINWNNVADVIQRAILFAEFTLLKFSDVAEMVWLAFRLSAIQAVDKSLKAIDSLAQRMSDLLADYGISVNLTLNVGLDDALATATQEFETAAERTMASFEQFVAIRRREFAALDNASSAVLDPSRNPMTPVLETAQAVTKEVEKFDAVLRGSAEAQARIRAYQERLNPTSSGTNQGGARTSASPTMSQPVPVQQVASANDPTQQQILGALLRIVTASETVAARPQVNVQGVALR